MPETSQIGVVLDKLVADLSVLAALNGTSVVSGDMGSEWVGQHRKAIMFLGAHVEQESLGMGQDDRIENYEIPGDIYFVAPGAGETAAKEARDTALEMFAALETYLADDITIGSTVLTGEIQDFNLDSGPYPGIPGGHFAEITFTIEAKATIEP